MAEKKIQQGQCSCTALRKATRKVSQLYDEALAPCGLRTTQRAILNHIKRAGTPGMGQLAEALVMDRGALAHNLKPLERDGFLRVKVDPNDRRNRIVALTELGKAKLAESEKYWLRAQKNFDRAFGATKTISLRKALAFIVSEDFTESFGHPA